MTISTKQATDNLHDAALSVSEMMVGRDGECLMPRPCNLPHDCSECPFLSLAKAVDTYVSVNGYEDF